MKINFLAINLLLIIKNTFAQDQSIKGTQATQETAQIAPAVQSSDECININSWLDHEDSFNCCTLDEITCENNHITRM